MRLNKYISHSSKYSRREADKLIEEGRVRVGREIITDFSYQVERNDKVYIDSKPIIRNNQYTVIVYNKLKGELVTKKDDRGRQTIFDTLPNRFKNFISIGRLDFASIGLILLTDSPRIATIMMNSKLERIYYIKVKGRISPLVEDAMKNGIFIEDATKGAYKETKVKSMDVKPFIGYKIIKNANDYSKIKVAISEGQNRELRRFFAFFDNDVVELKRVSFGGIDLGMLNPGKYRFLTNTEYDNLREFIKDR